MKHSPLQPLRYFVTDISCTAAQGFDPTRPFDPAVTVGLSVNATVTRQTPPEGFLGHSWSVEMSIVQTLKEGQNFPYMFKVALVGFFACRDGFATPADEEPFVRVNGSSMLYGAAREVIRSLTSRGPWGELFIPGISFYDNKAKTQTEPAEPSQPV
jgi:preprotein translocase subunit SecB